MPTGYTDCIKDNVSISNFILRCARAMGACVTMRDENSGTPIPERFEPSNFYADKVIEVEKELAKTKTMSIEDADKAALKEYEDEIARNEKYIRDALSLREKYESMLTQVNAWEPPTPDHIGLKKFMQEQISGSIDFDCSTDHYENKVVEMLSGAKWKEKRLKTLLSDLSRYKRENLEEVSRTESRNNWIKQLRGSLPIETKEEN